MKRHKDNVETFCWWTTFVFLLKHFDININFSLLRLAVRGQITNHMIRFVILMSAAYFVQSK